MKKTEEKELKTRCVWASSDPLMMKYHDKEWGVPLHNERKLFEFLLLEGAQAGLSWLTVLKKRDAYREHFDHFDAVKIARYNQAKINKLLAESGIIRNRLKISSAIINAKAFLEVKKEWGSFTDYIWHFVDGKPIDSQLTMKTRPPATDSISDLMSKDLKKRGFKFVGSTICYAFMQAVGLVNDHPVECFRYKEIQACKHK